MTVRDYKNQCITSAVKNGQSPKADDQLCSFLGNSLEIWSNGSCFGYIICAMEQLGYSAKEIGCVVNAVKKCFNDVSLEEAEAHYQNSWY